MRPLVRAAAKNWLSTVDPRELNRLLADASSAQEVLNILESHQDYKRFDAIHFSTAYVKLAKFERSITPQMVKSPAWTWLRQKVLSMDVNSPRLGEQAVANLMLSIGHLHHKDAHLMNFASLLANKAQMLLPQRQFKEQSLANMMWAIAKMKHSGLERVSEFYRILPGLCSIMSQNAGRFKPQEVSNALWAAGSVIKETPAIKDVIPTLSQQATRHAGQMKPQEMANTCWGLACCGCRDAVVLGALANATIKLAPDWSLSDRNMDLPMIIASFAKLKVAPRSLMRFSLGLSVSSTSRVSTWTTDQRRLQRCRRGAWNPL